MMLAYSRGRMLACLFVTPLQTLRGLCHGHKVPLLRLCSHDAQELNRLDEDANVFKLIGPALIRQDLVEAKSNVSKRIEYIKAEMDRSDSQLKSLESKNKEKEGEVSYKPRERMCATRVCCVCGRHSSVHVCP